MIVENQTHHVANFQPLSFGSVDSIF